MRVALIIFAAASLALSACKKEAEGLAKLVKSAALHRAADAGVQGAYTANYDGNTPMLAVNAWLGYDRVATHAVLICPL